MSIKDKIKETIDSLNFSFIEDINEDSFTHQNIVDWMCRVEKLSLGVEFDADNVQDYLEFSSLITVMREAATKIFFFANNLLAYADTKLTEVQGLYQIKYNELISDPDSEEMKKAKTVSAKEALANTLLVDDIKEVNKWKVNHTLAKNLLNIAAAKEKQIRETWFYVKMQWDVFSGNNTRMDFSNEFSVQHAQSDVAKTPVKPTFLEEDTDYSEKKNSDDIVNEEEDKKSLEVKDEDVNNYLTSKESSDNDDEDDILSRMSKHIDVNKLLGEQ